MKYVKRQEMNSVKEIVLHNTGLTEEEYLHPDPRPFIKNLDQAVTFFQRNKHLPVTIIGDYDVDGICGTAILYFACLKNQVTARTRLPHRFSEGYGLSEKIVDEIPAPGLIITVDNGIAAIPAIRKAKDKGLEVIVIDHHLAVKKEEKIVYPDADVIVDPNAEMEPGSAYKNYCGAALAYRFAQEICPGEDLEDLQVLASLATVADIMPVTGTNHLLVKEGLTALNAGYGVPGFRALADKVKKENPFTEEDYGYLFGPLFNAYGRLEDDGAEKVLSLLLGNMGCIDAIIEKNALRKEMEKTQLLLAELMIHDLDGDIEKPIVLYSPDFSEGIVGLLAGQLAQKYYCPAIVLTDDKDGNLKGSGRSIPGIHLKNVLDAAGNTLLKYGGHEGAAGLTLSKDMLEAFKQQFASAIGDIPEKPDAVYYDISTDTQNVRTVIKELEKYAPYGEGNRKPLLCVACDLTNMDYSRMGNGTHMALKERLRTKGPKFNVVGFGMAEPYEKQMAEHGYPDTVYCIGNVYENWYKQWMSYQLRMESFSFDEITGPVKPEEV